MFRKLTKKENASNQMHNGDFTHMIYTLRVDKLGPKRCCLRLTNRSCRK